MAKYLFLKHYRGAPASVNDVPMDQWTPAEIEAHMQYMEDFADRLESSGEYVDSQALSPEGAWVRTTARATAGHGRPVRRDQGPDRGLHDHRRRLLRARRRTGRRAVRGARCGRQADPRVARGASVHEPRAHRHRVMAPTRWTRPSCGSWFPASWRSSSAAARTSRPPRTPSRRRWSAPSRRGANQSTRRPEGLADHHGVAPLRRSRPLRDRAAPPRAAGRPTSRRPGRPSPRTTRCSCTFSAPTRASPPRRPSR